MMTCLFLNETRSVIKRSTSALSKNCTPERKNCTPKFTRRQRRNVLTLIRSPTAFVDQNELVVHILVLYILNLHPSYWFDCVCVGKLAVRVHTSCCHILFNLGGVKVPTVDAYTHTDSACCCSILSIIRCDKRERGSYLIPARGLQICHTHDQRVRWNRGSSVRGCPGCSCGWGHSRPWSTAQTAGRCSQPLTSSWNTRGHSVSEATQCDCMWLFKHSRD